MWRRCGCLSPLGAPLSRSQDASPPDKQRRESAPARAAVVPPFFFFLLSCAVFRGQIPRPPFFRPCAHMKGHEALAPWQWRRPPFFFSRLSFVVFSLVPDSRRRRSQPRAPYIQPIRKRDRRKKTRGRHAADIRRRQKYADKHTPTTHIQTGALLGRRARVPVWAHSFLLLPKGQQPKKKEKEPASSYCMVKMHKWRESASTCLKADSRIVRRGRPRRRAPLPSMPRHRALGQSRSPCRHR